MVTSKEQKLQRIKEWQKNNPDKRQAAIDKYHEKHKDQEKEYRRKNKDKILARVIEYTTQNRDAINIKIKIRRKNPISKLRHQVSTLVRLGIKGSKSGSILKFLPYTMQELKDHLEKQFEPWMTWQNHGKYNVQTWDNVDPTTWTWQLDHIIPQSIFPYLSMEDDNFKKC